MLALLVGAATANAQTGSQKQLPELSFKNIKGQSIALKSLAGQGHPTVISFWATWCSPCKKELTNIQEIYDEWQKKYHCNVVAISVDDVRNSGKVKQYIDGVQWPFEVLLDPNGDLMRTLNFQNVPYTILLDKDGNIVYTHNSYVEGDELVLQEHIEKLAK